MLKRSVLGMVGETPLIALRRLSPKPAVRIMAKMESANPGGSVKDRPALSMIEGAEKRGELTPGTGLIEATSGNTGIALAMIAGLKGYAIELVMPENSTEERIRLMRHFGAKVTLTEAEGSMETAIDYVKEKVERNPRLRLLDQFANPDNPLSHYRTTGPEIWRDTGGQITHFVSAMGTTGTIMGVSRFLKEKKPSVGIVGVQPSETESIPGIRRWPPAYMPKFYEDWRVDRKMNVDLASAIETAALLAGREGICCGISAGGAMNATLRLAESLDEGLVVCVICDTGERYLSSDVFGV